MFKNIDQHAPDYLIQMAKASIFSDGIDLNPFITLFTEYIDEAQIRETNKEIIFSSYNVSKRKQEYHNLENIPEGQLINYVMASARLPFFKPVFINGDKYIDGGIGDNQPYYSELENNHFDLVIKIRIMYIPYYIPGIAQNNITFDKELEITPSKNLGIPLEFKKLNLQNKFKMGYKDAKQALLEFNPELG